MESLGFKKSKEEREEEAGYPGTSLDRYSKEIKDKGTEMAGQQEKTFLECNSLSFGKNLLLAEGGKRVPQREPASQPG